eukprot:GHVP01034768.1.p1 GENE.GHVP01034768.1~~GHVP01034768.1.p1  ORF type:complete len:112 (+),score=32.06 GHVP01034768.1:102-437(+)
MDIKSAVEDATLIHQHELMQKELENIELSESLVAANEEIQELKSFKIAFKKVKSLLESTKQKLESAKSDKETLENKNAYLEDELSEYVEIVQIERALIADQEALEQDLRVS